MSKRAFVSSMVAIAFSFGAVALAAKPPNIVFMMVDDLGLYDFNCYGFEAVDTPNADKLASEGMLFRNAYAGAPVCSPSRAAVISGQAPARVHLTNHISHQHFAPDNPKLLDAPNLTALPPETVTYAERLKEAGYACGFFGKWHLSLQNPDWSGRVSNPNTLPDRQGFDNNFGGNGNGGPASWFSPYKNAYLENGPEGEYLPYRLADEAIAFMRANKDRPFLVNFWNFTVHSPLNTTDELTEKYEAKRKAGARMSSPVYSGMIEATDQVLGRILKTIDELGLRDNTLVVLTSDNGGINKLTYAGDTKLRMGKGWLYDGGLRIPLIVRWPGKVEPATISDERVTHVDFFPTFLEAANIPTDPSLTLDGESLVPLLTGKGDLKRDAVYFHYPNYAWHSKNRLGGAIIERDYKLFNWYDDDSVELYNIKDDPGESIDIADQNPELSERLKRKFKKWLKATKANMPVPNEAYTGPRKYDHDPNVIEALRIRDGLPNVFRKLKSGQPATVVYLGGSITHSEGWRPKTFAWLESQYPNAKLTHIDAAVPGTGADFAACRMDQDVLPHNPDLVFVEYRVNCGGGVEARAIDGIIRQLWEANPETDICLVYTVARWMLEQAEKGGQQQWFGKIMEETANHYGIPSIDFAPEVLKRKKAGTLIFQAPAPVDGKLHFSKDGVHPGDAGHELYKEIIARSLTAMRDVGTAGPHELLSPMESKHLRDATLVPIAAAKTSGNWIPVDKTADAVYREDEFRTRNMLSDAIKCSEEGASYTVKWTGTRLSLTHIPQGEGMEILVSTDGSAPKPIVSKQKGPRLFAKFANLPELPQGNHSTTVTIKKLPEGTAFYAGQFMVLRDPKE